MNRGELIKAYAKDHSAEDTAILVQILLAQDGGKGSGNFNHAGNPGHVGGSAPNKGDGGRSRNREHRTSKHSSGAFGKTGFAMEDNVHDLCKLDKKIYSCVSKSIKTDEVVVTNERLQHVTDTHPEISVAEAYEMMKEAVTVPDVIIEDSYKEHKKDTAVVMKEFPNKKLPGSKKGKANMRLIMRLATVPDVKHPKNSVITAVLVNDKKWRKYLRNKKILYKREGFDV